MNTLNVFALDELGPDAIMEREETTLRGVARMPTSVSKGVEKLNKVAVETLRKNMADFLEGLDEIIAPEVLADSKTGLELEEVEISVQIDGKGNVGLTGIVSGQIGLQGGLKFKLKRKPRNR